MIFWAAELQPEISPRLLMPTGELHVVVIDLRGPPSEEKRTKAVVFDQAAFDRVLVRGD